MFVFSWRELETFARFIFSGFLLLLFFCLLAAPGILPHLDRSWLDIWGGMRNRINIYFYFWGNVLFNFFKMLQFENIIILDWNQNLLFCLPFLSVGWGCLMKTIHFFFLKMLNLIKFYKKIDWHHRFDLIDWTLFNLTARNCQCCQQTKTIIVRLARGSVKFSILIQTNCAFNSG